MTEQSGKISLTEVQDPVKAYERGNQPSVGRRQIGERFLAKVMGKLKDEPESVS